MTLTLIVDLPPGKKVPDLEFFVPYICENLMTIGLKLRPVERELTNKQTYIQTHMSDQHTWRNLFRQVIKAPLIIAEIGPDELYRVQTAITRKLLVVRTF